MHNKINHRNNLAIRFFLVVFLLTSALISFELSHAASDTVVVYYSRTGKSEVVAKALAHASGAEIIQIKDAKERSGGWGFIGAAYDSQMGNYTQIEPANIDFSMYKNIYLVTPIWNWKLSVPMCTLLHNVTLEGKRMTMVTTANIDIKKYDGFGDDAPFIKRFLRDYLRDNRKGMLSLADIVQHFHIATEGLSAAQIEEAAVSKISKTVAARR
jgi:hypothetical protein